MIYEIPLSYDEIQVQSFNLFGYHLSLTLRYNRVSQLWCFDLYDQNQNVWIAQSAGLSVNSPVLINKNLPFVVVMLDKSGLGINSLNQNDIINRLTLYFIDKKVWHETVWQTIQLKDRE